MKSCYISSRSFQRDLAPLFPSHGNTGDEKPKWTVLSKTITRAKGCVMATQNDNTLSSQPEVREVGRSASYLPEPQQSTEVQDKGPSFEQRVTQGTSSIEEVTVDLGLNSANCVYSEEKLRSHKDPVMVPGDDSQSGKLRYRETEEHLVPRRTALVTSTASKPQLSSLGQ